jgi:uncharacterized protein YvpB
MGDHFLLATLMTLMTFERFEDRFKAYNPAIKHQKDGVRRLYEAIQSGVPADQILSENAQWAKTFSPAIVKKNPLTVHYFAQGDNGPEGWRECQPTSVAMCLNFLRVKDPFGPGIIDDNGFVKLVKSYGDVTNQASVSKALASLKIKHRFVTDCSEGQAKQEIDAGRPLAVGMLHHGSATAPSGGGHYVVIIGYDSSGWIVHDPYGEQDLVNGGFVKVGGIHGMNQKYSYKNFNPRWLVGGPFKGWAWLFD